MLFGDKAKPILTGLSVVMMSGIVATGVMSGQTWPYYTAATLAGLHLAWQVNHMIIEPRLYVYKIQLTYKLVFF